FSSSVKPPTLAAVRRLMIDADAIHAVGLIQASAVTLEVPRMAMLSASDTEALEPSKAADAPPSFDSAPGAFSLIPPAYVPNRPDPDWSKTVVPLVSPSRQ